MATIIKGDFRKNERLKHTKKGYVIMWKSVTQNSWIGEDLFDLGFWTALLMEVNYCDEEILINGQKIIIKRGELLISQRDLAKKFKITKGVICNKIGLFTRRGVIRAIAQPQVGHGKTLFSIVDYDLYQPINFRANPVENHPVGQTTSQNESKSNSVLYSKLRNNITKGLREKNTPTPPPSPAEAVEGTFVFLKPKKKLLKSKVKIDHSPEVIYLAESWLKHTLEMIPSSLDQNWCSLEAFCDGIQEVLKKVEIADPCNSSNRIGISISGLTAVLDFIRNDAFWCNKVLSPGAGLKRKFAHGPRKIDTLLSQMAPKKTAEQRTFDAIAAGEVTFDDTDIF